MKGWTATIALGLTAACALAQTPVASWYGEHSGTKEPRVVRLRSQRELSVLLDRFTPKVPGVRVDFEKAEVLAVFLGERTHQAGVLPISVDAEGEGLVVRVTPALYSVVVRGRPSPEELARRFAGTPYGLILLPRTTGPIRVLEQTSGWKRGGNPTDVTFREIGVVR